MPDRFWSKVAIRGIDDCWEWRAGRRPSGYGMFAHEGKIWGAHRFAFTLMIGEIPEGKFVCHTCDNPPCCNPGHLVPGTARENAHDAAAKHRLARSHEPGWDGLFQAITGKQLVSGGAWGPGVE